MDRLRRILAPLFPEACEGKRPDSPDAPPVRFTPARVGLTVLAVLAGTGLSLTRTKGPGALNSVWAEDGKNFLTDALNRGPFDAVTTPFNGYFHLLPRLLAEIAALAPVGWAAAVMSTSAALTAALLAVLVYTAAGAHTRSVLVRLLVAVPLVVAPVGQGGLGGTGGSVINNLATLQFPLLYATFWALLWAPASRTGRGVALSVVLLAALSSPLAVIYLPLAIARVLVRGDITGWTQMGWFIVGAGAQFGGLALGVTSRADIGHTRIDPGWVVLEYGRWLVPNALLGEAWWARAGGHTVAYVALGAVAWLVLAAVAFVVARRLTRPRWHLAAAASAASLAILAVELATLGARADRYLYTPALLLIAALAALLEPADQPVPQLRRPWLPAAALAVLLVVVGAANWRVENHRARARPWSEVVAGARAECAATHAGSVTAYTHSRNRYWTVRLPCARLS
ncbi:MAG: hypothetical protein ACM30G_06305 [Micromonosporaceae bacterium]